MYSSSVMRWRAICEYSSERDVDELEDWVVLNDIVLVCVYLVAPREDQIVGAKV
jgi:hypothetical protein